MEDSREYFKTQRSFKVLDSLTGNKKHSEKAGYEERAPGAMNSMNFKNKKTWRKKKPLALISTPPKSLKKTAAQRVKIFLLQEEKGWLLSSNSGLFTDIFSWGAKGAEPESRGGGAPVLKRLACHSLPNFGINHL